MSGGVVAAGDIVAIDISEQRREIFQNRLGIHAAGEVTAAAGAEIVLLCVKPYQIETVLRELAPIVSDKSLFISVAAGIGTDFIASTLGAGKRFRVVRAMPNTPMLVGMGMVAIAPGKWASAEDMALARRIFESAAKVIQTNEDQIDAVTAVSGSGPAYFFFLTEQMIRAGIELGLSAADARTLAIQTAAGAAK